MSVFRLESLLCHIGHEVGDQYAAIVGFCRISGAESCQSEDFRPRIRRVRFGVWFS